MQINTCTIFTYANSANWSSHYDQLLNISNQSWSQVITHGQLCKFSPDREMTWLWELTVRTGSEIPSINLWLLWIPNKSAVVQPKSWSFYQLNGHMSDGVHWPGHTLVFTIKNPNGTFRQLPGLMTVYVLVYQLYRWSLEYGFMSCCLFGTGYVSPVVTHRHLRS